MADGFYVISKDLRGWKVLHALRKQKGSKIGYEMSDGSLRHDVHLATMLNLSRIAQGQDPLPIKDQFYPPCRKAQEVIDSLDPFGMCVDRELRLKKKLGSPLMDIKAQQITMLIMIHQHVCEQNKKNPESTPVYLTQVTPPGKEDEQVLCYVAEGSKGSPPQFVPMPDDMEKVTDQMPEEVKEAIKHIPTGKFALTADGRMMCLKSGDWALIPKTADMMMMYKYIQAQEGFDSLEEFTKRGGFLSVDGEVCHNGLVAMEVDTLSIDQFAGELDGR